MPKHIYKKTDKGMEEVGILPSLTEWNGKVNKSGDTITGNLTIKQGFAINVSQYNDAGGVSLMNNGNGTATQFGSSARPARMFSSVQPEWYKNGVSQGVLAIKSDIPDISGKVNKAGDTMSGNLSPSTTQGASLGTSSLYWNNIYGTTIYENGKTLSGTYVKYSAEQSLTNSQKAQARKNIGAGAITEIKVNGTSKGTSGSVNLINMVTFASSQTATVAGTSKTTYTYNQPTGDSNTGSSNGSAYFPEGIIMGGTAASAGLVTRGICGVTTPDATTGACNKENLYINYDGDNTYKSSRQLVLQAGSIGTHYGYNLYEYAAARGDAVKNYCDATYAKQSDVQSSLSNKADLENGKVPSSQLPSYVDDVEEYTSQSSFPATGTTGKIYVDTTTNLTFRWSGTSYVVISPSLALGETSSTAYAGNKGAENAKNIQTILGYFDSDGKAKTAISAISAINDGNGRDITATYVNKTVASIESMAGSLSVAGSLTSPYIATGKTASSYFQSQKFRGEGNAATYYHAVDFGFAGHNQVDFYEYGGLWNFWKNTDAPATTADDNLCLQIGNTYIKNKGNIFTWPTTGGILALTDDLPTQATSTKLGLVKSSTTGTAANRDYNVEVNSDGTMKVNVPWTDTNTDTNTSHGHSAGVGLVGSGSAGTGGGTYTYKAKLRSETALTVDSAAATTTSGRVYPVAVDKSGYLSVNVPWTDTDTNTHNSHAIISGTKSDNSTQIKGSASSGDITLGDSGVTAGTYRSVTVNSKGIVVAGSSADTDTNT